MKTIQQILIALIMFSSITINAQELRLNTKQSTLNWTGKAAFNAYSLTGTLQTKEGTLKIKNNRIVALNITINMKSLDHENSDLKKHLRSKDFFEVKEYTKANFKITKPALIENNTATIVGNMTIKDITKEESIIITISNNSISFNHTMDRTAYDIKFNSPSFFKKMKENAIADEFQLKGILLFE